MAFEGFRGASSARRSGRARVFWQKPRKPWETWDWLRCWKELVGGLVGWMESHGWLVGWLLPCLVAWWVGGLVGWSVGWWVGWLIGVGKSWCWLVGWNILILKGQLYFLQTSFDLEMVEELFRCFGPR